MREILKGSTSITLNIVLRRDDTGLGKTGLIFSDITGSYTRNRAARTAITMATLASASAAWSSGGFIEIDATNCPGLYRFDVPDAAFATGVRNVVISAKATGVITEHEEVILTGWDNQDAVRGGLSALPNAAAAATGGLACLVAFGGTATAGGASTVTLPSPASTVADFYKGLEFSIIGGTGAGQSNICSTYSTGRVATLSKPWATNPDATSVIEVRDIAGPPLDTNLKVVGVVTTDTVSALGTGAIASGSYQTDSITSAAFSNGATSEIAGAVWDEARSGHTTAGSFGQGVASVQGNVTGSAASVTGAVGSVASGGIAAASFAAGAINAAAIATDAITAAKIAADAIGASELAADAVTEIQTAVAAGSVASVTGNVGGIATGGIVAGSYAVDAITSGALSTGAAQEIAGQVWDVVLSGHLTAGTTGNALNAAGSAGDPWGTALPGAYGSGTAGFIVGTNLNATVLSRSSHTAADVWAAATRTLTAQTDTSGTTTLLSRLTAGRATNLDFIDVALSSRLATAGYTAPPSAATVASAILATALAELTAGVFPATPTVAQALMLPVHMLARGGTMNKTTGVSTYLNNAGATILKRTDSDDGNVFTEGALVAGP